MNNPSDSLLPDFIHVSIPDVIDGEWFEKSLIDSPIEIKIDLSMIDLDEDQCKCVMIVPNRSEI